MVNVDIIKRDGKTIEKFSAEKLQSSIEMACLSVRTPVAQAQEIAHTVTQSVIDWLKQRSDVTSDDLRRTATRSLEQQHPEAAYLYKNHHHMI